MRCSAQNKEDAKFCTNCGASISPLQNRYVKERDTCFGEGDRDRLGKVSFGFFVIVVGIVLAFNPGIFSDFGFWIEQMTNEGTIVRPSTSLITSAMLFFGMIGVSNFVMAATRAFIDKAKRRMISDILSGVALVLFAYLISLYNTYSLTWQMVLGIEVVAIGLLIVSYSILRNMLPRTN
jgi:uncharacterized membrane protein